MSGWSNYEDALLQLRLHGLMVDGLDIDTAKPRRCRIEHDKTKEKRGWYWLSTITIDGESLIVGAFGIYHGADSGKQTIKLSKSARARMTPEQIQAQKSAQNEARRRAMAEEKRIEDLAAARATQMWKKLQAEGACEYLERKQIGAHGVRYTDTGALVIPMTNLDGDIRGLQFILPRGHERLKKTGRDKEFWPSGMGKKGTFHLIGGIPRDILLMAEGYATASTLHEATGYPVAICWDAGNMLSVVQLLHKKYRHVRILACGDDDWLQKCASCNKYTLVETENCQHCGLPHGKHNAGKTNANAAAVAIGGGWVIPEFSIERPIDKKGPTDFNDLHVLEGLQQVRAQVEAALSGKGWLSEAPRAGETYRGGGERAELKSMLTLDEAEERFALVFGGKGTMFDYQEHNLVPKADVLDILPEHGWRDLRARKKVVRLDEVGFDPSGADQRIKCNLFGGWPTMPKAGKCDLLLELLEYLCSNEENSADVYQWVLRWLAYPLQNPGAKMKTAIIFHGPQGTGKNLFFESYMAIFDVYGRIVDQAAIEDKFNDWASRKLFLIADEVVARQELFHIKNKLKGFVTGEWIRINPKNVAAHDERNHVNLVFLSNEHQPLVLEKDDRRYTVIHTPVAFSADFYREVRKEIEAGGVAALHDYLLKLSMQFRTAKGELVDFDEHTKPPMTRAKQDLIDVSMDSIASFLKEWQDGDLDGVPFCPCLGSHLYKRYKRWCDANSEKPRSAKQFIGTIKLLPGWSAGYPVTTLRTLNATERISRKMVIMPQELLLKDTNSAKKMPKKDDQTDAQWLTECFFAFAMAVGEDEE